MMKVLSTVVLGTLACHALVTADEVRLNDGSSITGEVLGLDAGSSLKIAAEISPEPLSLKADQISRVSFSHKGDTTPKRDATLMLVNGDRLPCDVLGISEEQVHLITDTAGNLTVDRNIVSSIELGMSPRRLIYKGPTGIEDWKVSEGWQFEDGSFVSDDEGSISASFDELPESFSLSFTLEWFNRPNFQVYFCSEHDEGGGGKHNRYYLQFNQAGFELKRQIAGEPPYQSLGVIERLPKSFNEPKVEVELRVDRRSRLIVVYLDGQLQGSYGDPLKSPPGGNKVIFHSNLKEEEGHEVSSIQLKEWDSTGDRHRSEDRGEGDGDALIDYEGQRFSGRLLKTANKDDASVVLFQSPHFPKALEIPIDRVSTIFLARPSESLDQTSLVLNLSGEGVLSASDCRFESDQVKLEHPLLGAIQIDRKSVRSMVNREARDEDNATQDDE